MASTLVKLGSICVFAVLLVVVSVRAQGLTKTSIGSYCTNYLQCAGNISNSYCYRNRCECQPGYTAINGSTCSKVLGARCWNYTDCKVPGSYCAYGNVCVCQGGLVQFNNTFCGLGIGSPCSPYGGRCNAQQSYCLNGRCSCPPNMQTDPTFTRCISYPPRPVNCSSQCYGPGAYCNYNTGACNCYPNYMMIGPYCYEVVSKLGEKCDKKTQVCSLVGTRTTGVECDDKKCKCKKGYKASKDKLSCNSAATTAISISTMILMLMSYITV